MKQLKGRLSWTERERAWLGSITWTERERALLGYKRKQANFIKGEISLSQPPWENREANAGNNPSPLPEVSVSLSKENKWTRD